MDLVRTAVVKLFALGEAPFDRRSEELLGPDQLVYVTRLLLSWLGIEPHIARRNTPHGSGLGKVRWVVERTIS